MARVQEESEAMKESALLERKAKADMKRRLTPMHKALPVEPTPDTVDPGALALEMAPEVPAMPKLSRIVAGKHAIAHCSYRETGRNAVSDQSAAWRDGRQGQKVEQAAG